VTNRQLLDYRVEYSWAPMPTTFQHWIDSPSGSGTLATPYVLLSGWIAAPQGCALSRLRLVWGGRTFVLQQTDRPDVRRVFPTLWSCGFQGLYALADAPNAPEVTEARVCFELDGEAKEFAVPVRVAAGAAEALALARARKADVIRPVLRCPACRSGLSQGEGGRLACGACGQEYGFTGGAYDFLPESLRSRHKVVATSNISAWGYDARTTALIERFKDGLILDCGCGLRPEYLANIVNFEIAPYPTTDVLGVGQALPFEDDSFDAVFSFAVLEHVSDPFACARELARVLKPGGVLFAIVPFLQPFHGYPDHYYNMTSSGLKNLFDDRLTITECGVPQTGLPIFTLAWFLNSYLAGLDHDTAARFAELKVKDLTADPPSYFDRDIVRNLSAAANEELASTNYVLAEKPR
jgi:SAM-dependent methyltransferase